MRPAQTPPPEFLAQLEQAKRHFGADTIVFEDFIDQRGDHPEDYRNFEMGFAANTLAALATPVSTILDVGSNRLFVAGLSAGLKITTVDVRLRQFKLENETLLLADSKKLPLPEASFDIVLSVNAIEHFGLGRYGEDLDFDADRKAFKEWVRILRPGGHVIFSTTINSTGPAVAFNAHRVYALPQIHSMCQGLSCIKEAFYSHEHGPCETLAALKSVPKKWDLYAGVWRKPA